MNSIPHRNFFHEFFMKFHAQKCMKFHEMKKWKIFPFYKMADPQANSLREFAIKWIRMINSDPKWEFPKEVPWKIWIIFSTRVKRLLSRLTLVDIQENFSLEKFSFDPFGKIIHFFHFWNINRFLSTFSDFFQNRENWPLRGWIWLFDLKRCKSVGMALRVGILECTLHSKTQKCEFTFETGALLKFNSAHSNENTYFHEFSWNFRLSAKKKVILPKGQDDLKWTILMKLFILPAFPARFEEEILR